MFHLDVAPGIELRMFENTDAPIVFAAVERNREWLREWLPWVDTTHSPGDVEAFIAKVREQFGNGQGPQCGIWVDAVFRGGFGCHPIDWAHRSCSIGYWIEQEFAGRGIVSRCCTAMLDYLFGELCVHRVEIRCGTGNRRSCAIPERLGFHREGTAREAEWVSRRWVDLVIWSMLEDEWKSRAATS
jgi:ribosomal-protein-serine acetyltransferase